jgi:protein-S-isoprenylcysteine O-methyltransferase Ste14
MDPSASTASSSLAASGDEPLATSELSLPRSLLAAIHKDPEHLPERLVMIAHARLSEPSFDWARRARAENPTASTADLANSLAGRAEKFARVNGALAGTPFLLALVPAYVSVLWREAQVAMCVAALNGTDPREPGFAGELLALRGLYETADDGTAAIAALDSDAEKKDRPKRGHLRLWATLVYRVMILAGFLSAPDKDESNKPSRWKRLLMMSAAGVVWVITCVAPITFMMLMAWSCENDMRGVADSSMAWYGGEGRSKERMRSMRERRRQEGTASVVKGALVFASLALPLLVIGVAVAMSQTDAPIYAIASLTGLVLVLVLGARAARI